MEVGFHFVDHLVSMSFPLQDANVNSFVDALDLVEHFVLVEVDPFLGLNSQQIVEVFNFSLGWWASEINNIFPKVKKKTVVSFKYYHSIFFSGKLFKH